MGETLKPSTQTQVVYRHTVEALLDTVVRPSKVFTEGELKERKLVPPTDLAAEQFASFVKELGSRLGPTVEQGLERVGRELLRGFFNTLVGRPTLLVLRLLGPQRSLMRVAENLRTGDNFTEVKTTVMGPGHVRLEVRPESGLEAYQRGLLSELLGTLGMPTHHIEVAVREGASVLDVKWEK